MPHAELARIIDEAFDQRDSIDPPSKGPVREAVETALDLLDRGELRVAQRGANGNWQVNLWLKKAVLLSFRLNDMSVIPGGPGKAVWWDKVLSKFDGWDEPRFGPPWLWWLGHDEQRTPHRRQRSTGQHPSC